MNYEGEMICVQDALEVLKHASEKLEDLYYYFDLDPEEYMIPADWFFRAVDFSLCWNDSGRSWN